MLRKALVQAALLALCGAELQVASLAGKGSAVSQVGNAVGRCRLGRNGPEVSCIAYGTLHLHEAGSPEEALKTIKAAVALGITTFDLSDVYNQEPELFGAALQLEPGLREKVEVIAKMDIVSGLADFGFDASSAYDTSAAHLEAAMDRYLKALNTTYLDVLMFHRQDYIMDVNEVATAFAKWKAEGKVRYLGASNFDRSSFELLSSKVPVVANEIEISPINPTAIYDGTVAFHYNTGTGILAWSPLGGDPWGGANRLFKVGSLDGSARNARIKTGLGKVGSALGCGSDVAAVAWLMRHPAGIIPIIGTMNPDRLKSQAQAGAVATKMSRQQWYYIADAVGVPIK